MTRYFVTTMMKTAFMQEILARYPLNLGAVGHSLSMLGAW